MCGSLLLLIVWTVGLLYVCNNWLYCVWTVMYVVSIAGYCILYQKWPVIVSVAWLGNSESFDRLVYLVLMTGYSILCGEDRFCV